MLDIADVAAVLTRIAHPALQKTTALQSMPILQLSNSWRYITAAVYAHLNNSLLL